MSRKVTSLAMRLLVMVELLMIIGWIGLFFTWHAPAAAVAPVAVLMPTGDYRVLRQNIDDQMQELGATTMDDGILGDVFMGTGDLDHVFVASVAAGTVPEMAMGELPGVGATSVNSQANEQPRNEQQTQEYARMADGAVPASGRETGASTYRVSSIICGATRATAVLVNTGTGESLFLNSGQTVGEWQVVAITDTAVTMQHGSQRRVLMVE